MAAFSSAIVVAVVGLVAFAQPATAQTAEAFAYGGPIVFPSATGSGNPAALISVGGGLEALTRSGVGASVEAGLIGVPQLWAMQLSVNAIYEKRIQDRAVRPFVSGGLSPFGSGAAINFGAGLNIWGHERTALRLEVRDYVIPAAGGAQAIAFRVGVTFR
jgi:hypothetical protein